MKHLTRHTFLTTPHGANVDLHVHRHDQSEWDHCHQDIKLYPAKRAQYTLQVQDLKIE